MGSLNSIVLGLQLALSLKVFRLVFQKTFLCEFLSFFQTKAFKNLKLKDFNSPEQLQRCNLLTANFLTDVRNIKRVINSQTSYPLFASMKSQFALTLPAIST